MGFVAEVGVETYAATSITRAMTMPAIEAGHIHLSVSRTQASLYESG